MQEIFSKSADCEVEIADEVDYFQEVIPKGWFVAVNQQQQFIGFVRSFKQNEEWSRAELYIDPYVTNRKGVALDLIRNFFRVNTFDLNHRVRFDVQTKDLDINLALEQLDMNRKAQTFHYFEMDTIGAGSTCTDYADNEVSAKQIAETLNHLHPVSEVEAKKWLADGSIRFEKHEGQVAAAAQVYFYQTSAEINRIATHSDFARKGYAKNLIGKISNELRERKIPKLFLKVESVRHAAIQFYKKNAFVENIEKQQTWHSFYVSQNTNQ